jgi:hypothetical protein
MKEAAAKCPLRVMGVETFQNVSIELGADSKVVGGAILLSQVGKPIDCECGSIIMFMEILESLFELHRNGVTHGDAHLPNIVEMPDGSFRWIDLQQSDQSPAMIQRDFEDLTKSMLNTDALPWDLDKHIRMYSTTGMDDPKQEVCREAIKTTVEAALSLDLRY